ncbi:MAG: riboflavin synthase [Oscillospiraceae bacterium]|nr:riboflavin synthase [Oscillospiraceae bacterium]
MFTGIVEEVGTVKSVTLGSIIGQINLKAAKVLEGTNIGDSIAVNGVCLTVTPLFPDCFTADVMQETLRRSNHGALLAGDKVDLERAMPADGRFGGHIVSGHIDGVGFITEQRREGNAVWVRIQTSPEILRLIVEKGSIAIDGISLTVAAVSSRDFQVSLIPHTADETILLGKRPGSCVNLENDILGKYVQKLMQPEPSASPAGGLTLEFLEKNGF